MATVIGDKPLNETLNSTIDTEESENNKEKINLSSSEVLEERYVLIIKYLNYQRLKINNTLKILQRKKLGFVVVVNNNGLNKGIFTDGDLKRLVQKKRKIEKYK